MRTRPGTGYADAVTSALVLAEERSELGAFWALDHAGAAEATATEQPEGSPLPLAGIPVAVKDLFDQRGLPTTAGLPGDPGPAASDSEAVRRLRRAGAVPIGKTAMDPLACTTGGQAPGFPPCVNPVDPALSPGGSSSGSAVAVAAGIVPLALASDTAGSARIPAAYCGIVGFKPVRRSVPRRGCVAVMPGFDTPSLIAESVTGCERGYAALVGRRAGAPAAGSRLRLAVLVDLLDEAEGVVAAATRGALDALGSTAAFEEVELGWEPQGFGMALAYQLSETWGTRIAREPERFTDVIRDTAEFGRTVEAAEHERTCSGFAAARARLRRRLRGYDAFVCPTVPIAAPLRGDEAVRVSTRFTRLFNALDWPAISIPVGRSGDGAPIGLQVAGLPSRLRRVFDAAARIERAVA